MESNYEVTERIGRIFARAVREGFKAEAVEGATDVEIDAMARLQDVRVVPEALRAVLRILGSASGAVLPGTIFGVHGVELFDKEYAINCVSESDEHEMRDPAGMFVFSTAGGYSFLAIDGADVCEPDPPVWNIIEPSRVERRTESVSVLFDRMIDRVIEVKYRLVELRAQGRPEPAGESDYRWD